MFLFVSLYNGWVNTFQNPTLNVTFKIDASFCNKGLIKRFFDPGVFAIWHVTCTDVHSIVEAALLEWQQNSKIMFSHTRDNCAHILFNHSFPWKGSAVATTTPFQKQWIIDFNQEFCFYARRSVCVFINKHKIPICIAVCFAWALAVVRVCELYLKNKKTIMLLTVLTLAVCIVSPLLLFTVITPCLGCIDFKYVLMHEIGHAIGFQHSNSGLQSCGCGVSSMDKCQTTLTMSNIMNSVIRRTSSMCLGHDDINGLRTVYGGECHATVKCTHQSVSPDCVSVVLITACVILFSYVLTYCITRTNSLASVTIERPPTYRI